MELTYHTLVKQTLSLVTPEAKVLNFIANPKGHNP
jgi:hypothetical protein